MYLSKHKFQHSLQELNMDKHWSAVCAFILALCVFVNVHLVLVEGADGNVKETLPKPGHCPRRLNVVPSHKGCECDEDCPENHKCCVFDCGAVCVPPAFTKKGVCPRRNWGVGLCVEFCSDDSDCPNDEKCCFNGCGHTCTVPYTVKRGHCPSPRGTPMCAEYCYHDGQCPGEQKCCRTTCGHACSEPC